MKLDMKMSPWKLFWQFTDDTINQEKNLQTKGRNDSLLEGKYFISLIPVIICNYYL